MPSRIEVEKLLEHREWLQRLARGLVADLAQAEDLVQDTWTTALRHPPDERSSPRAWLATVARNLARNRWREGERRAHREIACARTFVSTSPDELVARAEMQARVARAVLALDEPYRATVLLRYFDGLPPRAIARTMGVSVEAVKSRLRRAHGRLRDLLSEGDEGNRSALIVGLLPLARGGRTTLLTGGGLAMTAKGWLVAAAAVVLLGSAAAWSVARRDTPSLVPTNAEPVADLQWTAREHRPAESETLLPPVDLAACDRNLDLFGVVVDGAGNAVAGAKVETFDFRWQRTSVLNIDDQNPEPGPTTRSSRDGTFALRLRHGAQVLLRASAPGLASAEIAGCQSGERVHVVLARATQLVVHCIDETGAGVAGATVKIHEFDPVHHLARRSRTETAAASGDCVFGDAPSGTVQVIGWHPRLAGAAQYVGIRAGRDCQETLRFRSVSAIRGRVTDADSGAPVANARVAPGWTFEGSVGTDADGVYELGGSDGALALWVRAAGFAEACAPMSPEGTHDVALERGDEIRGRLVGPDGRAVAGSLVAVTSHGGPGSDRPQHLRSGADGGFVVADLRHDQPHTLTFIAEGYVRFLLDVDPPSRVGGRVELGEVTLPSGRFLEGRVVGADGNPVPNVSVKLYGFNEDRERLRPGKMFVSTHYGCREERRTDDLGRFRFPDLAPGDYDLEAWTVDVQTAQKTVTLGPEHDVTDIEIRLPGGRKFDVEVADDAGSPVAGVTVHVQTQSGWSAQTTTSVEGRACFALPAEPTSVDAFPWTRRLLPVPPQRVDSGAKSASLVIRRASSLRVRCVDPEGRPFVPHWSTVHVFEAGRPLAMDPLGGNVVGPFPEGSVEVPVPLNGAIDLVMSPTLAPGGRLLIGELLGLRADATDAVLRAREVPLDRRLTVVVLDPDGRPEPGAEVEAWIAQGRKVGPVVAGPNGRAYLEGLPATEVTITGRLPADHPHRTDWIAASSAKVTADSGELELSFTVGRRVAGRVRGPDGQPVAGATVWIYLAQANFGMAPLGETTTGSDGRFAVAVPRGETKSLGLYVRHIPEYGAMWDFRQEGIPDPATDLDLTLRPTGR